MAAQGGLTADEPDGEPVFLSVPIHDVLTPLIGAFGVVTGWWQQGRPVADGGGGAQLVRTSLVESTMAAQAAEFTRYEGRPPPLVGGFDYPGGELNTWTEEGEGFSWTDGDVTVPVESHGLTASKLAAMNELTTVQDHPVHGPLLVFGQLIGGAGPAPAAAPELGADTEAVLAELGVDDPA